jgi:hypothetical protein
VVSGKIKRGGNRFRRGHTNWVIFARNSAENGGERASCAVTLLPDTKEVRCCTEKSNQGKRNNVSSSLVLGFLVPVWAGVQNRDTGHGV